MNPTEIILLIGATISLLLVVILVKRLVRLVEIIYYYFTRGWLTTDEDEDLRYSTVRVLLCSVFLFVILYCLFPVYIGRKGF